MRISVAGGKGGTGKTLVAVCLTEYLAGYNTFLLDADVEEPDAGLFFYSGPEQCNEVHCLVSKINLDRCNFCDDCAKGCQFNGLVIMPGKVLLFPELCHSCMSCYWLCSQVAISRQNYTVGNISEAPLSNVCTLVTGRLKVGEARTVPVIRAVKAKKRVADWEIIDCPPGTGCSIIEAIKGTDYCLLVTEPTPLGRHDLALALEVTRLMQVPAGIVVNRWQGEDGGIDLLANENGIAILARIPYDMKLAQIYSRGQNPYRELPWLNQLMAQIVAGVKGELSC